VTSRRPRVRAVRYRTRPRRTVLGLLALLVTSVPLLGLAPGLPPGLDQAALAQTTSTPLPLTLTATRISPTAPQPGDMLTVGGVLSNPTDLSYDGLSIALRLQDPSTPPLQSRSALLAVATSTDHFASINAGDPIDNLSLGPGGSVPYLLTVPVDALPLTTAGVYRISVEAYRGDIDTREYDGRVNTFLPWLPPSAAVPPVQVAWVWPLLSTPRLLTDNTFVDDGLGVEIGPRSRLGLLLGVATQAAAQTGVVPDEAAPPVPGNLAVDPTPTPVAIKPVPVTPVIDPENLQELGLMADPALPYQVRTGPGAYSAAAASYLAELQALMAKTPSIVTPYGDPDIEALFAAHAGQLVTQAQSTGLETGLTGVATGLMWPPDGSLSQDTLDQLTVSGLVLSNKAVPVINAAQLGYTPTARTDVSRPGGTVPAVVVDDGLSRLATTPVHVQDRALLLQRFAAETAAIAVEGGAPARTLVLAPGRRWSSKGSSIRSVLDESGQLPWLSPVTVPQALQSPADPAVTRAPLHRPPNQPTLPSGLADRIAATNNELADFRSILCPAPAKSAGSPQSATPTGSPAATAAPVCNPDEQTLGLQRTLYRSASTAFRKPGSGETLLDAAVAELRTDESQVKIVPKGDEVLVGSRPRLPISIVNNLKVPVKVQVVLRPRSAQLRPSKAITLTIPAGANVQQDITITVRSARAGQQRVLVDAQLLTPQGHDFGTPVPLQVRVSGAGQVVVVITIAVCGLLGLAVIVRLYKRIRNARRRSAEPEQVTPPNAPEVAATAEPESEASPCHRRRDSRHHHRFPHHRPYPHHLPSPRRRPR
jgi:hypothetical protein